MVRQWYLVAFGAGGLILGPAACAPRPRLCFLPTDCRSGTECVAGQCLPADAPLPYPGARRLVLRPTDIAVIEPGSSAMSSGALPPVLTLGSRAHGPARLLLRFDLRADPPPTILRASILLERVNARPEDPAIVSLRGDRIIGRWDAQRVRWSTSPAMQDVRAPRTLVDPAAPSLVRVDVTAMARRWASHDPADQGVAIEAENDTPTGVTFSLGGALTADPEPTGVLADEAAAQRPRLEIYAR